MLRDGEEDVPRGSDQRDQGEQAKRERADLREMFGIDTDSDPEDDPEQEERSSQEDEEDADEEESTYGTKKKLKMKTVPVRVEMEILKTAESLLRVMMGVRVIPTTAMMTAKALKHQQKSHRIHTESHRISPNPHPKSDLRVKSAVPAWFYGFESSFDSWDRFHAAFDIYRLETFKRFTKRTSTSKARKVAGKKTRKAVTLVPDEWVTYSNTLVCTHGQPYEPKGKGKRNHNNVRDTNCPTRVNLTVTASISGRWYLRANASGSHNHAVSKHTYEGYAENRTVKDSQLKSDVAVLRKAGATAKGILQYLRERTGKKTNLKDVHNMVERHNASVQAGLTDAKRAFAVLEDFTRQRNGNAAQ
ncbi:hypothetical protein L914_06223, partial [Phytophthora nicotianae]